MRVVRALRTKTVKRVLKKRRSASVGASQEARTSDVTCLSGEEPSPLEIVSVSSQESEGAAAFNRKRKELEDLYKFDDDSPVPGTCAGATSSSASQGPVLDLTSTGLVRLFADGTVVPAAMRAGPAGFALARFPGSPQSHEVETEMPNLALPAEAAVSPKVQKKPSAAEQVVVLPLDGVVPKAKYKVTWYKSKGSYGIRELPGDRGRQLLSIGSKEVQPKKLEALAKRT
eukprot:4933492-Lingulodinium_polyedra.AAC.1